MGIESETVGTLNFDRWAYNRAENLRITLIAFPMLYSALIHTIAFYIAVQADTCVNGGAGPCLSGLCPVPTMVCIKPDDICCEANQVIAATTVAPVTTAAITTTPGIVTVATTKAPTTTCVDKVNAATGKSDCISMSSYCNNAAYYSLMTDQCPKTCGRCSTSLSTTSTGRFFFVYIDR
ncbi:unnamed protein product [Nippostrongylus brasiliensis]|uniref:ShKT domain-containing protein n=1 Tax=Nippostrongylus brasiliensis TaxID=27835 RepID=A0A0N4YTZ4_NIPBR|nr:unnamed protein product [Nippostrongylus brasiliensis]